MSINITHSTSPRVSLLCSLWGGGEFGLGWRTNEQVEPSHAVVIVEGNYLLLKGVDPWDGASGLFDETWAIRCPPEVCGERYQNSHKVIPRGGECCRETQPTARLSLLAVPL